MAETIVGLAELAAFFGVSVRTISRWIAQGKLPAPGRVVGVRDMGRPMHVWQKSQLQEMSRAVTLRRMTAKSV